MNWVHVGDRKWLNLDLVKQVVFRPPDGGARCLLHFLSETNTNPDLTPKQAKALEDWLEASQSRREQGQVS